uniref:Luc7 like protein-3 n=1 Tax=Schmidtea mediterranea TaxID=79327 RepID=I1ZIH3_SCHMD|nr:luc7 like protein-3 [Schmidtea mediterranea]
MALASQAALLDELMGINRNSNSKKDPHWDDESVCKYYLAGFCPHELFVNTKMSLGACPKLHDINLLNKYKNSSSFMKVGFEKLLKKFLGGFVRDVQRKIEVNKNRLENGLFSGTEIAIQKRITMKENEINETVETIEKLGNEGRIEECQFLNNQLEEKQKELKYDKIELENHRKSAKEKQEDVCNICGAYISKNDPRNSIENHVSGRIHCGYVRINEILEELDKTIDDESLKSLSVKEDNNRRDGRERKRSRRRSEKDSSRSRHRSRCRTRSRSHERKHKHAESRTERNSRKSERQRTRSKSRTRKHSSNKITDKWKIRDSRNGS